MRRRTATVFAAVIAMSRGGRYPVVYNLHGAGGGSPDWQWDRVRKALVDAKENKKVHASAKEVEAYERPMLDLCRSPAFSTAGLAELLRNETVQGRGATGPGARRPGIEAN